MHYLVLAYGVGKYLPTLSAYSYNSRATVLLNNFAAHVVQCWCSGLTKILSWSNFTILILSITSNHVSRSFHEQEHESPSLLINWHWHHLKASRTSLSNLGGSKKCTMFLALAVENTMGPSWIRMSGIWKYS